MDSDNSGAAASDGSESSPNFVNKISNFADRHILELRVMKTTCQILQRAFL